MLTTTQQSAIPLFHFKTSAATPQSTHDTLIWLNIIVNKLYNISDTGEMPLMSTDTNNILLRAYGKPNWQKDAYTWTVSNVDTNYLQCKQRKNVEFFQLQWTLQSFTTPCVFKKPLCVHLTNNCWWYFLWLCEGGAKQQVQILVSRYFLFCYGELVFDSCSSCATWHTKPRKTSIEIPHNYPENNCAVFVPKQITRLQQGALIIQ